MVQLLKSYSYIGVFLFALSVSGCSSTLESVKMTPQCGNGLVTREVRQVGGMELRLKAPDRVCVFERGPQESDAFSGSYASYMSTGNSNSEIVIEVKNTTPRPITLMPRDKYLISQITVWEEYLDGSRSTPLSVRYPPPSLGKKFPITIAPGEIKEFKKNFYPVTSEDFGNKSKPRKFGTEIKFVTPVLVDGNGIFENFQLTVEFVLVKKEDLK